MINKPFLEAIDERVLVCDGAMGTMLYAKGVFINRCFDSLNVMSADTVTEIHQDYVRAGADVRVKELAVFRQKQKDQFDERDNALKQARDKRTSLLNVIV